MEVLLLFILRYSRIYENIIKVKGINIATKYAIKQIEKMQQIIIRDGLKIEAKTASCTKKEYIYGI